MKRGFISTLLVVLFAATTTAAFADCYVNPKGDLVGGGRNTIHGCHKWGASARCDRAGSVDFHFKNDPNISCTAWITANGATKWDAYTTSWHRYHPDNKKITCKQYWVNNNTLDVTGTLVK